MPSGIRLLLAAGALLASASCSTTRVLEEDQYRLASNSVTMTGESDLKTSDITPYIKQQANSYFIFGWNPFLNVYNWQNGSGKGLDKLWSKLGTAPVVFEPSLAESSCENIRRHLEYLGYYGSDVKADITTDKKLARVNYTVTLGKRYQIDTIIYDIPASQREFLSFFEADSLSRTIHKGDWLSEKDLEAESARGAAALRNYGYYDFSKSNYFFQADTLSHDGKASLTYSVRPYTRDEEQDETAPFVRYRFGKVSIAYPSAVVIRQDLLRKLNLIKPGNYYNATVVDNTYSRMSSVKALGTTNIHITPSDSSHVDCTIKFSESGLQGIKFDLEASTNSSGLIGIAPKVSWFHKNIFHGGEWLDLSFTGNFQFQPGTDTKATDLGVSTGLSFPSPLGLDLEYFKGPYVPRTEIKTSYNYQNRPEYRRHMASLNYGYSISTTKGWYHTLYPLQVRFVRLDDISEEFNSVLDSNPYLWDSYESHMDAGIGGTVFYSNATELVPKTSYRTAEFQLNLSGNVISLFNNSLNLDPDSSQRIFLGVPYSQYVRASAEYSAHRRFGADDAHSIGFRAFAGAGYAYGNSSSMPYERQFFCGGASSMRGWQTHALGPGYEKMDEIFSIPSQTGDLKLELDAEWRFKMFWKFEGAMFAEAGNVWNPREITGVGNFLGSVAADWGLGLRLNLNFILLRIDAGFKLHEPSRPEGSRWLSPVEWFSSDGYAVHFGVGYPF